MAGRAIIAGRGLLPQMLAEDAAASGVDHRVVTLEGVPLDWTADHPTIPAMFEKLGRLFSDLKAAGMEEVVLAGAVDRPKLNPLRFDATFARLSLRLLPALRQGDDAALRVVVEAFERAGFTVRAPQDLLADLTIGSAMLVGEPSAADRADVHRAAQLVRSLGTLDIGQGAVVAQGICLGVETIQGTDAMLAFAATGRPRLPDPDTMGGVLYKAPKSGQETRVDLPAIGPETIRNAAAAGLSGVVIAADGVIVLGRDAVIAEAKRLGLFVWSRAEDA